MKVVDLRCGNGHGFEGWFGSEEEFQRQQEAGQVECPLCADRSVHRLPSAPRLNLSGARAPRSEAPSPGSATTASATPAAAEKPSGHELQAAWMQAMRQLVANTEDVGERFAHEARRIHYGETPQRGIRGQASADERAALAEEGIEVVSIHLPEALKGPMQ
ncbi:MAG: DUF1178 family protein [Burkholderiales bacterium]|nr:DUF1178 family protein [Burkholderiales bacterium]